MKKLLPLLLLIVVSAPAFAAKRQFDIEVIIFKREVNPQSVNESWPNNLPPIDMKGVGSFYNAAYLAKKGVTMLPPSAYKLDKQVKALQNHAGFQVLMHVAWRQGDQGRWSAPVFKIQAGKDYSSQFDPDGTEKQKVVGQQVLNGVTEHSVPKPLYELDGKLQIYVEHYLYADTTLDLREPSTKTTIISDPQIGLNSELDQGQNSPEVQVGHLEQVKPPVKVETILKTYQMKQKRRMRSSNTYYLDNPLMGMIIQVRKVK
ncbi:peptidoglycan binding protein CsiV [Vibrio sp. S4M6]|uniref:peptidoglycan binding protein CsiV n=1 Tax=Vibrio sinus TaxID=2946865 RepID=UPI002029B446|nr:peptidoglycan binding protein CsiV [Vibrio sinus]MCL9782301.1 peptidoglycan binding protein CsiV [Vibrio sinus]